jgi:hypothetical protein
LQALVILNEETFVDSAIKLGEQLESELSDATENPLGQAHRLVTGRQANADRLKELAELFEKIKEESPEHAGTAVAQVLLNLDETLTY